MTTSSHPDSKDIAILDNEKPQGFQELVDYYVQQTSMADASPHEHLWIWGADKRVNFEARVKKAGFTIEDVMKEGEEAKQRRDTQEPKEVKKTVSTVRSHWDSLKGKLGL